MFQLSDSPRQGYPTEHFPLTADLLKNSSIELTSNGLQTINSAAEVLPADLSVYVPKLPRQTLEDKLVQIAMLRESGLEPIPHIAARQLCSAKQLKSFVKCAVSNLGVRRVLVIGGDSSEVAGPYTDSASVIQCGILTHAGIREIDVAGYPEKHPRIPRETLATDLKLKLQVANEQQFRLNIVTQFSFSPARLIAYCDRLAREAPGVTVFAGMAGPTSAVKLLNYARICGVSTSVRAMNSLGKNAVKLALNANPDKQFELIKEAFVRRAAGNLAGVHLFSFGGFTDSARWLSEKAQQAGI